ncbi:transcriptional regulator [Cystobacter fuscus]|uniref:Transcriptional regulator n=1 Tax=Cystobacter fuscus TaxID=43 RepID=A0A250JDM9_9BACT|nr:helix-turn-helix transcriptional regulator [Cystobacter fuscus]ATB41256.1 transcriptional regulator [Cystobacter fuscus]
MSQKPVTRSPEKDPLSVQIGGAARKARMALKLSQEEAAELVGVATEVYGKYERGDLRPSTPTLVKLSKALGTSVDVLIGLAGDRKTTTPEIPEPTPAPMPREFRRLRRTLRTMDKLQLATFTRMAAVLVTHKRRRQRSRSRAQAAAT